MPKKGENIYKRKDGRWEGRYIRFRNIGGKTEYGYIYGKSYAEVKQKLMSAKAMAQPHNETRGKLPGTYGQLLDDWLHSSKITVKDSTYARYAHLTQKHIKPHLGYLQFSQLTSQIVEDFIVSRLKAGRLDGQGGLAPKTVTDILTVIRSTIGYPEPREGAEAFKRIDLNAHQAEVFNMFTGTETTVKLRCANHLADVILEQFGKDTILIPDGEDDFTVSVPVQISKPFYAWAAGFGADMKILFPQAIVNEMRTFIQELSEMYQDDGKM